MIKKSVKTKKPISKNIRKTKQPISRGGKKNVKNQQIQSESNPQPQQTDGQEVQVHKETKKSSKKPQPYKVRVKVPIYERTLLIIVTDSVDAELKEAAGEADGWPAEASVLVNNHGEIVIIIRPDANTNTICHETFHVVYEILKTAGVRLSSKSEEAFAYLCGFISEKIEIEVNKFNKKNKRTKEVRELDGLVEKALEKKIGVDDGKKRIKRIEKGKPRQSSERIKKVA